MENVVPEAPALSPDQKAFINSLRSFRGDAWQAWIDDICNKRSLRLKPPTVQTDIYPILTYTYRLLNRAATDLLPQFEKSVVMELITTKPIREKADPIHGLIETLTYLKPKQYESTLLSMLLNPNNGLSNLKFLEVNLQASLLNLCIHLNDGVHSEENPNHLLIFIHQQIGKSSTPYYVQISLRFFLRRRYNEYFQFVNLLSKNYNTPEYSVFFLKAFQELIDQRPTAIVDLYKWLKTIKRIELNSIWLSQLRLIISKWLEGRNLFKDDSIRKDDPHTILLYAEAIAGIKYPIAPILSELIKWNTSPNYPNFSKYYSETFFDLLKDTYYELIINWSNEDWKNSKIKANDKGDVHGDFFVISFNEFTSKVEVFISDHFLENINNIFLKNYDGYLEICECANSDRFEEWNSFVDNFHISIFKSHKHIIQADQYVDENDVEIPTPSEIEIELRLSIV